MSDDEDRIWYLMVAGKGKQSGPFTWDEVRHWVAQGKLLPQDFCWKEGMENWVPLFSSGIDTLGQGAPTEAAPAPGAAKRSQGKRVLKIVLPLAIVAVMAVVLLRSPQWAAFAGRFRERVDEIVAEEGAAGAGETAGPPGSRVSGRAPLGPQEELARLKRRAQQAVDASDWRTARRLWGEVAEMAGADPELAQEVQAAEAWVRWADLTQRPSKRFTVLGVTIGAKTVVRIRDERDEEDHGVRIGDEFAGFVLDAYDAADKSAQISSDGRSYRIESVARP